MAYCQDLSLPQTSGSRQQAHLLRQRLNSADGLLVEYWDRHHIPDHIPDASFKVRHQTQGANVVEWLTNAFDFEFPAKKIHAIDDASFETLSFLKGDQEVARLYWLHPGSVCWQQANTLLIFELTERGAIGFADRFRQLGLPAFWNRLSLVRQDLERAELVEILFAPEASRAILRHGRIVALSERSATNVSIEAEFMKKCGGPTRACKSTFCLYGVHRRSWWQYSGEDLFFGSIVKASPLVDLLDALNQLEDNQRAILGASRFFLQPDDDTLLRRLPGEVRGKWLLAFVGVVVDFDIDENRSAAIWRLADSYDRKSTDFLVDVLYGRRGGVPRIHPIRKGELSVGASAALMLGMRGVHAVLEDLGKLALASRAPADRAAYEIASALLEGGMRIKGEHFEIPNARLGLAALNCIAMNGDMKLDLLVKSALRHSEPIVRERAVQVFREVASKRWPERKEIGGLNSPEQVSKWWNAHRPLPNW